MSYRFKSGEVPLQGLRRICRDEIECAIKQCLHPAKERGVTVHETRKHLKKVRAALLLAAPAAGKDRHTHEDKCLRDIGKLVSALRDAHVRLQTLLQLRNEATERGAKGRPFPKLAELLAMERESFSAAFSGWQKQAVVKLEASEKRIAAWPLDELNWKQVCSAVAKSYRLGRDALALVLKKPTDRNLHEWRKKVKELLYQLRLLQPLNRVVLDEIATDAKTLGQLLGRDHDFAFLLARLDREKKDVRLQKERDEVEKLIRKLTRRLRRNVIELGRRFYAEPPKAFAKRISIFIDDWVSKKKTRSK